MAPSEPPPKPGKSYVRHFAASSSAPALAAVFTNPIEVCKVRQQMDKRPGGLLSTLRAVHASDGIAGLQAGLRMAVVREGSKSIFRIGLFEPIVQLIHDRKQGPAPPHKRLAAGMSSGALSALICNPIELVKTRQQAASLVGAFEYKGPIDGLLQLHRAEGLAGMWRGTGVSMARSAAVTGPHLTTYTGVKELCVSNGYLADAPPLHVLASLVGGLAGIVCNQPLDVVRNRLYSQPLNAAGEGTLYRGALDCAKQLVASEGPGGLYRGFWSHYIRVGPHYVLTFVFLEQIKAKLGA